MTGLKVALLGAIASSVLPVGDAGTATDLPSLLEIFKTLGTTGLLLYGLIYVVKDAKGQREKMEALAMEETKAKVALAAALAEHAAATRTQNSIMEDMRVAIEKCGGPK